MQFALRSSPLSHPLWAGVALGLCALVGFRLTPASAPATEPPAAALGVQAYAIPTPDLPVASSSPNLIRGEAAMRVTGPLRRPSPPPPRPMPRSQAAVGAAVEGALGELPPPRPTLAAVEGKGGTVGPFEPARLGSLVAEAAELVARPPTSLRNASALTCLAASIYHEARDQPLLGRQAVAAVILRRVTISRWGDTICAVVQPSQFSYLAEDYSFPPIVERRAWREALTVAIHAMVDGPTPLVAEADHYHAIYVSPSWRTEMQVVMRIGGHVFYRDPLLESLATSRDA